MILSHKRRRILHGHTLLHHIRNARTVTVRETLTGRHNAADTRYFALGNAQLVQGALDGLPSTPRRAKERRAVRVKVCSCV
jgi:hypothetical protein